MGILPGQLIYPCDGLSRVVSLRAKTLGVQNDSKPHRTGPRITVARAMADDVDDYTNALRNSVSSFQTLGVGDEYLYRGRRQLRT